MYATVLTIDVIAAIMVVILVLLQQGKGANIGVSFGAGASNTVFGSRGAASFLFKMTVLFTTVFFASCLALGYLSKNNPNTVSTLSLTDTDKSIASQYSQYQKEFAKVTSASVIDKSQIISKK